MKSKILLFFSLFLFLLTLSSCNSASSSFKKGNYEKALAVLEEKKQKDSDDYFLMGQCLVSLGREEEAFSPFLVYLLTTSKNSSESRAVAVKNFLTYNTSQKLTLLLISKNDGSEAQRAISRAKAYEGNWSERFEALSQWFSVLTTEDSAEYLGLFNALCSSTTLTDEEAKKCLELADLILANTNLFSDNLSQASLLKTKGNLLELLFDRVSARIYWTQSLKLNPFDVELRKKLQ